MENEKSELTETKPKKNNIAFKIVGIIILVLMFIGGFFLGRYLAEKQDNASNSNVESSSNKENEEIKLNLTTEDLTKLIDKYFYHDLKGNDLITDGEFTSETKLYIALDNYTNYLNSLSESQYEKEIKLTTADNALKGDNNFIYDKESEWYTLKNSGESEIIFSEDVTYYPYDKVNEYHKKLFNSEAPKTSLLTYLTKYYYSSKLNAYLVQEPAMGSIFDQEPIYGVKDYRVENKQLIVSVYHTTYEWDTYNDNNDVLIVMDKDKKLKYKIVSSKEEANMKAMKNDMLKNHTDKMDVYDFVFDIDGDNYYLTAIKK